MPVEIRTAADPQPRSVWRSMSRGFRGRCPNCGKGKVLRGYLTPVASCSVCGEDLSHQRSDDFGPYVTMIIVGHVVVPSILFAMMETTIPADTILAVALPATGLFGLALLRPVKGAIIGLQWALRMHGFDGSENPDAPEAILPVVGLAPSGQPFP